MRVTEPLAETTKSDQLRRIDCRPICATAPSERPMAATKRAGHACEKRVSCPRCRIHAATRVAKMSHGNLRSQARAAVWTKACW